MKLQPESIEAILRGAPAPRPPADLKTRLLINARRGTMPAAAATREHPEAVPNLLRDARSRWHRWVLLLFPAGIAVAMASAWVVQTRELQQLRREQAIAQLASPPADSEAGTIVSTNDPAPGGTAANERQDIARLRALVADLERQVAALRALEGENRALRESLAQARTNLPPALRELQGARDRAEKIRCVNNLKQMGIAVRVYATDHQDEFPPDFISMATQLVTPKVLVCPSDAARLPAESWDTFASANVSYEFLSPGPGGFLHEPTRVLFRCPIHGNIGLCDGSVHMGVAKDHPESIVSRNGALHMQAAQPGPSGSGPAATASTGGAGSTGNPTGYGMSEEMRRRYGLPQLGGSGAPTTPGATGAAAPPFIMSPELMRRYGLVPADPSQSGRPPTHDGNGNLIYEVNVVRDANGEVVTVENVGPAQGETVEPAEPVTADEPQPEFER